MSISEVASAMDALEEEAARVLARSNLTPVERRLAFGRLLAKYRVLEEYQPKIAKFREWLIDDGARQDLADANGPPS